MRRVLYGGSVVLFFLFVILPFSLKQQSYADTSTVSVTAAVNAHPSDFSLALSSSPDASSTLNQFQTATFTITYGATLLYNTPMTIVASWDKGTIAGQPSPSVDIVDYVPNSAGNAYGNTPPVIDLNNKTITWTIASFPANTSGQTVSFQLKTTASYTGTSTVTFPVTAHMSDSGVTIPDASETMTYQYNAAITPTATPTSAITPTTKETITPAVSTTPSSLVNPSFSFTDISLHTVSANDASVAIVINQPSTIQLQYGLSPAKLDQAVSDISLQEHHRIMLPNLTANTKYYFRVKATNALKHSITSDYFSFTTALASNKPDVDRQTLIITSSNVLLFNSLLNHNGELHNAVILPDDTTYDFQFALSQNTLIKNIRASFKSKYVLAAKTTIGALEPNTDNVDLLEIKSSIYEGRLKTPATTGWYQLSLTISDTNGNIAEVPVVDVKVVNPMKIIDKQTRKPIEKARIFLSQYNTVQKKFLAISSQTLPIPNPSFSDAKGSVPILLPQGQYIARITAPFYNQKSVTFSIASDNDNGYPQVLLQNNSANLASTFTYYDDIAGDFFKSIHDYLTTFAISGRYFNLFAIIVILLLVCMGILSISVRTNTPLLSLPWLLIYSIHHLIFFQKHKSTIGGVVIDEESSQPVKDALVLIINADTNTIVDKVITNVFGEFYSSQDHAINFTFSVQKKGYDESKLFEYTLENVQTSKAILEIRKKTNKTSLFHQIDRFLLGMLDYCMEVIIILAFITEVLFSYSLGWGKTLPFLAISSLSLFLSLIYSLRCRK